MDPLWGLLQKSAIDDETIEEAIARLIQAHDADETSHLETGEALQSHKASEIIDHLALSIIADKIGDFQITRFKLSLNSIYIRPNFESADKWTQLGTGDVFMTIGGCVLQTTAVANAKTIFKADGEYVWMHWDDKNASAEFIVAPGVVTNFRCYVGIGDFEIDDEEEGGYFIGFKIEDSKLYSLYVVDGVKYTHEIQSVSQDTFYRLRWVLTATTQIEFYVNEVLQYTADSNIPAPTEVLWLFNFYAQTKDTSQKSLSITGVTYTQDR